MEKLEKTLILAENPWLDDVKIVERSESTQKDAKSDGQLNTLYLAEQQTGTYGRFGRQYFASNNGGIYMSLSIKPDFDRISDYTLLAGAAVVTAIENLTDKKPQIKWVNDIYLNGKKIVGILAEAIASTNGISQMIIGIGINFHISAFPVELQEKAGSLFDEKPNITRNQLIAEIWKQFDRLSHDGFFEIYKSHSLVLGKTVEFVQNAVKFDGIAENLTEKGELIVKLDDGSQKILSSGEISLKKWS